MNMKWYQLLRSDVERNSHDNDLRPLGPFEILRIPAYPALQAIALYRLGHALQKRGMGLLAQLCHALSVILTGCDIHPLAEIGERLLIGHPGGIVIGRRARLGSGVTVMQGVTVGRISPSVPEMPTIGRRVYLGAGATVLGPIHVGEEAAIGANALVMADVPARAVVVAARAEILEIDGVRQVLPRERKMVEMAQEIQTLRSEQDALKTLVAELAEQVRSTHNPSQIQHSADRRADSRGEVVLGSRAGRNR